MEGSEDQASGDAKDGQTKQQSGSGVCYEMAMAWTWHDQCSPKLVFHMFF